MFRNIAVSMRTVDTGCRNRAPDREPIFKRAAFRYTCSKRDVAPLAVEWDAMKSLELFTGAGGLALGIERAGFHHVALVEYNRDACQTLRLNSGGACLRGATWPIHEMDVREFTYEPWAGKIDLLAGGPPCQPFSIAGKHAGDTDRRNMFPEVFRAARVLRPRAIIVENVRGLARETFRPYLEYIRLQLRYPTTTQRTGEGWIEHAARLRRHLESGAHSDLSYRVYGPRVLNLVDYGVPQQRQRLIFVAIRADIGEEWAFPEPTHSQEAMLYDQWVTGAYWRRHKLRQPKDCPLTVTRLAALAGAGKPQEKPWRTVRDALHGLPEPEDGVEHPTIRNHIGIPGARSYYGHSGSPYDLPAKTLKAGDHGVPGGENALLRDDGTVRYFSVRESARLQTFPDDYAFSGSRTEAMRQIGNAVPVMVGESLARRVRELLRAYDARARRQRAPTPITERLLEARGGYTA